MITLLIFSIAFILIYILNLCVFLGAISFASITFIYLGSVVGIFLINLLVAGVCCKIFPNKWFNDQLKLYRPTKKECRFYEKIGIKKWKDKTAEWGGLNGFSKNKIEDPNSPEYIKKFILEINKGFLDHFISLFISFFAIFILPSKFWLPMGLPIAITSFILNIIPVFILRYNMPRLQVMLKFAERKAERKS